MVDVKFSSYGKPELVSPPHLPWYSVLNPEEFPEVPTVDTSLYQNLNGGSDLRDSVYQEFMD